MEVLNAGADTLPESPPPDNSHRPRCRELGLSPGFYPTGPLNAITDVEGVSAGHSTLLAGEGALVPGRGPVRTGVTAILPHGGNLLQQPVEAAVYIFNGAGTSTGLHNIEEYGFLETPLVLTNTMSVGAAYQALTRWCVEHYLEDPGSRGWFAPVVGETCDAFLNDIYGFHIKEGHVVKALNSARGGTVAEGVVGAGTGIRTCGFKAGIGSASRVIALEGRKFTVGVLVQSNMPGCLVVDGVPVGRELGVIDPEYSAGEGGSIMVVIATNLPLDSRQLKRLAARGSFGMALTGANGSHRSGDFFIAFSTTRRREATDSKSLFYRPETLRDEYYLTPAFQAVAEATGEAILNSIFKAVTVTGRDGNTVEELDLEAAIDILRKYGKLR